MVELVKEKISLLEKKLENRKNDASVFFKKILIELEKLEDQKKIFDKLRNSYAITQYGNFNSEEEKLLGEIIEIINKICPN